MMQSIAALILSVMITPLPVMSDSTVKPYMDYRTITDYSSPQYQIVMQAAHEPDGRLTVDGYTCAALGQNYGKVGDRFIFTIGGEEYKVIMADAKRWCDTAGCAGWTGVNGHQLELVVDSSYLSGYCKTMGDCNSIIPGSVESIVKVERRE